MSKKTPLHDAHLAQNGKVVDFHGWLLPIHYGSQIEEHHAVRQGAGMFDVSHMTIVDLIGQGARDFLRYLIVNDVDKLRAGRALYTVMTNEEGGIIDDLIVYRREEGFRLVLNAATFDNDMAWLDGIAESYELTLQVRSDLAMLAVQGPAAREKVIPALPDALRAVAGDLKPFAFAEEGDCFVARTGYTGEDGFEIILPEDEVENFWAQCLTLGFKPCGLGARDTLRLEAGLNLYGNDMDLAHTPIDSNVAWTIAFEPEDREFIGKNALLALSKNPPQQQLLGLLLLDRGVLRADMFVYRGDEQIGVITSGTFSPTLQKGIAMARIDARVGDEVLVEARGKKLLAKVVKLPFVRRGKVLVEN